MCGKKLKIVANILLIGAAVWITGCEKVPEEKDTACHLVIEDGDGYQVDMAVQTVQPGNDAAFTVTLDDDWYFLGTDYRGESEITKENGEKTVQVTLHDVQYSESIGIQAEKGRYAICYDANGGQGITDDGEKVRICYRGTHARINTSNGTELFAREGYTLLGWNTAADGSGQSVGLGSRVAWTDGIVLYAQWVKWTDSGEFQYRIDGEFAVITGYSGHDRQVCIPGSFEGYPVRTICEQAFADADCETVILPPGIHEIEKWAFKNSSIQTLYMYDDLEKASDYAFQDCTALQTLHINAIEAPVYSGGYFDTFPDKYDRLLALRDQKKIVLFSGSSTRFGYDSAMIDQAFPDYEVVNMGVFAYSPAVWQLELIRQCMKAGDILLDSPEFDAPNRQFCHQKELDYAVFAMVEADYDAFSLLDLREYTQVFTAFSAYQEARQTMERKSYDVCAADYDEDGKPVAEKSYNVYGDYIVYRPNAAKEEPVYGLEVNYTVNAFPKDTYIHALNTVYQEFLDGGVHVYFTYSPRNRYALSKDSTKEERARLHAWLKTQLIAPVISELEESLYSGIYMYGTDNHLSTEGVQIRTKRVIRDLKAELSKEGTS